MGERVEMPPRRGADERHQRSLSEPRHLADGCDSELAEPRRRHGPDAPQTLDREGVEEGHLVVRLYQQEAVRLGDCAGDLREVLRPGDADRDRQPDPLAHLATQPDRSLRGGRHAPEAVDVEERLVDRQPFDQRRDVVEDAVEGLARLRIGRHAGPDDDEIGAQPPGAPDAHRGSNAVGLRLVARREHYSGAHHHGPAAQPRVVALLDGSEEGVDVGVEDRRPAHEHMFAHCANCLL